MWWGEELWWWVGGPGVDALWTGVDLGIRLVAMVERRGVFHEGAVLKVVRGGKEDLFLIAALLYRPTDRQGRVYI